MTTVISLATADRPDVNERQREFCKALVSLGLSRLTITSLVLGKDTKNLTHADINTGHRVINGVIKELGHNIVDARHARSPVMADLVAQQAKHLRIRVKIA
jgi:hypothetical protein